MKLSVEHLTPDAFAPFGEVISIATARDNYKINLGTTTRFHDISRVDVADGDGAPIISIFRGTPRPKPIEIKMMERHPLGSQAFMPLSAQRFLIVVAAGTDTPKPEDLRAFLSDGTQGVTYAKNVWHHPLLVLEEDSDFLIVDRSGPGENLNEIDLPLVDGEVITLDWA
ncbi:MAG: ureidoglycolate lyase [Thalassospira sp.]|uniref:ureidoglycolate lyase n=1 Tax=Thalassospira sp. TaxID=1912094 RepID=UPI0032EB8AC7|tara:strand:+ start:394 stop:900 length:507 start_codon:yes stop_codon:yes gene_type:complete